MGHLVPAECNLNTTAYLRVIAGEANKSAVAV